MLFSKIRIVCAPTTRRFLSSTSTITSRLLLSVDFTTTTAEPTPRILYPPQSNSTVVVRSMGDIFNAVEHHYSSGVDIVGGMGETDPGVWFIPCGETEPMQQFEELIKPSITHLKEWRHGIPFGIYTSGTTTCSNMEELNVFKKIQVSLFAATPNDYCKAVNVDFDPALFGKVCNFLVAAQETPSLNGKIEVGVIEKHAAEGRELATSFGASEVHVYPNEIK